MTNEAEGLDLDALEKVAREAAVQSRWQNGIEDLEGVVAPDESGLGNVICLPPTKRMYSSREDWPSHANHIATFDPPTVLRLLAALRAQAERVRVLEGELEDALEEARDAQTSADTWLAEHKLSEARAEAAERRAGELEGLADRVRDFAEICRSAYTPEHDGIHRVRTESGEIITGDAADCLCELAEGVIALGDLADAIRPFRALLPATQAEGEK